MREVLNWRVDILIGEEDGKTYAEATLVDDIGNHLAGTGRARLSPADVNVPEIGDEIAVGRALVDLGQRLLGTADDDLEAVEPGARRR